MGQHPKEVLDCWAKTCKRIAALLEAQSEGSLQTAMPVPVVAMGKEMPGIQGIADIHEWLTCTGKKQYMWEEQCRKDAWRSWVQKAWGTRPGQIYAWLKEERHTPVVMLEDDKGQMTGNLEAMDELLRDAWMPIMRKYGDGRAEEPPVDAFVARYGRHILHHPMEIEPITGARLHRKFCTMRISSEGVDGWDLQALRDLPLTLHVMLAGLLEKVEKRAGGHECWPWG